MSIGFIKLHRKMMKWEWYQDANAYRVFTHLLMSASFEKQKWRGIELLEGQIVTGRMELSNALKITEQQTRTALDKLKSTNEITIKSFAKYSIITIVNWHDYQDGNQQDNQQITSNQPAFQPTSNHYSKEVKNIRSKEKKERKNLSVIAQNDFSGFWDSYPRKTAKQKALAAYQSAIRKGNSHAAIIGGLAKHCAEWSKWTDHERQFIPHAATWLNGKRWEEEPERKGAAVNRLTDYEIGIQNAIQYQINNPRD